LPVLLNAQLDGFEIMTSIEMIEQQKRKLL